MVSSNYRIGIIGSGTSGVYLANLLVRQGISVDLFEKAPYPRTQGCGILLIQAGMKALHQGSPEVCQKIIESGVAVQSFEFRNLRDQIFKNTSVTYSENELPGMLVQRRVILEALLESLPKQCLHLNTKLESVTQTEGSVIAHFSDGSQWQGDLLVGSDGIYSKVREYVVSGTHLHYLGDIVWRGVVANPFCHQGKFIVYARGRGIYANFFDLGNNCTHWGFFTEAPQDKSELQKPRPSNTAISAQELAKLPPEPRSVIESTPVEQITCCYSYDIDPLPRLFNQRIVLIGDAAHAKSPTRARGMSSGFEDALSLSQHLAASGDIQEALTNFQAERMPIVHSYQQTSRELSMKIGRSRSQAAA